MSLKSKSILFSIIAFTVILGLFSRGTDPSKELMFSPSSESMVTVADPDGDGPLPAGYPRVEGELVIDFQDGFSTESLQDFNQELGHRALYHSVHSLESALTVARVPESEMGDLIEKLSSDPRVEAVSPNYIYSIDERNDDPEDEGDFPNDPEYKYQWHMDQINAEDAWRWTSGEGVVSAVIDTGVAYEDTDDGRFHCVEDLVDTKFVEGYDFINHRVKAYDDHCHGTHVAGTVAQSTHNGKGVTGVAFGSTVMPVKVLSGRGSGTNAGVADGIRFAADNGAKVMNLSLGGPSPSDVLDKAVKHAVSKGVLVVCAAGNGNQPRSGYPAGCEGAISVSALDYEENLTFYSNYGSSISIAAPGGDTRSDKNGDGKPDGVYQNTIRVQRPSESGYFMFQGTSMACPHAAGVFVLGASMGVTKYDALLDLIYSTARPAPEGGKTGYGAGILDAGAVCHKAGFEYGQKKLMFGLLAGLLGFAFFLRKGRIGALIVSVPALLAGAVGVLWWMPAFGLNDAPLNPLLVNGFPSWDLFCLGVENHGTLITHSALIPLALSIVASLLKFIRPLVAGFSAGVAGHLAFVATHNTVDLAWLPEEMQALWLWANVFFCVVLATAAAAKK